MAVTIKDIAQAAGVSHTTVSRALRGSATLAPRTVARIQEIAKELGYIPNTVARGLKTKRSGILGVLITHIHDPFFAEVISGIEDVLLQNNYSLFLASSYANPQREADIVQAMSAQRVDGVIICSTQVSEAHRQQLEQFGVPTVLMNNQATEEMANSLYHDDMYGSRTVTEHLIGLGHGRIAYLGNEKTGRTNSDRLTGYQQALQAAGLAHNPAYVVQCASGSIQSGAAGASHLLRLTPRPTAVVCFSDRIAIGAMQTLHQAGWRIPETCSLTGFDNIEMAAYTAPPLTTFNQPKRQMGIEAAQMMLSIIEQAGQASPAIKVMQGQLVVRASTAVPPPTNEQDSV